MAKLVVSVTGPATKCMARVMTCFDLKLRCDVCWLPVLLEVDSYHEVTSVGDVDE